MILVIEWISRIILLGLVGLSIWSVAVILSKRKELKELDLLDADESWLQNLASQQKNFLDKMATLPKGLRAGAYQVCRQGSDAESIDRGVAAYLAQQKKIYEKGLLVLGTLGSITPFIGLLGTIMGIIVAFGSMSSGKMDSQKIMYSLAEALIATAVGLAVAIPAVVAFNVFSKKLNSLMKECESIRDQYIAGLKSKS